MSTTKMDFSLQLRFVEKSASPGVVPNLFEAAPRRPESVRTAGRAGKGQLYSGRKKDVCFLGSSSCVFF